MGEVFGIVGSSLRLEPGLWRELLADPGALKFQYALWIVVLAGLSEAAAQSVALFMSRVRRSRFGVSLLLSALLLALSYLFYVVSIELVAETVFGRPRLNVLAFKMIALTYAPYLFAVVTLMPYFGQALSLVLAVYHVLALLVAVAVSYSFSPLEAALCLAASWLLVQLVRSSLGRPLLWLARSLRNRVAGTSLMNRRELKRYYDDLLERDL